MSFLFKKLLALKAAKAAVLKPAIEPAPVEKVCNISADREKLIQQKIDALEAKAAQLDAKAESVRDHYQDKADGIRDLYENKADFYSCKGGRLGEKFAAKFSALGDKKANLLEAIGEKKAFALECASDKLKAKADLLREQLSKDEDPGDDELDGDDEDDIINDGDDNGNEPGSELPADTASIKFFLDVEEDNGLNYMYYLTIQAGEGDEEFTLDDAYEQALAYLDERNLELKDLTQVDIQNSDGEKIAEYQFVDGSFVRVDEVIDGLWMDASEDDLAAYLDDADEDQEESVGG